MNKILVTGGTTFVSKYIATYFVERVYDVYVLNRNTKEQVEGVTLLEGDRHNLGNLLKNQHFDVVADITAYTAEDISSLVEALGSFDQYVMISSSAVYPEYGKQPFKEESEINVNSFWGKYGTNKIDAERKLLELVPHAYILRPPYLYGPMNNVYREAFVFDCARMNRPFYLPPNAEMQMQFHHIRNLAILIEKIMEKKPKNQIINTGNPVTISIRDWVTKCYAVFDNVPTFIHVTEAIDQRNYFPFVGYQYILNVERQMELLSEVTPLEEGLKESVEWYLAHEKEVTKKPYQEFIDSHLVKEK